MLTTLSSEIRARIQDLAAAAPALLAQAETLTVYDAAYLELALRLSADLATLDTELRRAAGRVGVRVLP